MSKYMNKCYCGYRVRNVIPTAGGHNYFMLEGVRTGRVVTVRDNFMTKLSRREAKISDRF